jgi:hypothetical protein
VALALVCIVVGLIVFDLLLRKERDDADAARSHAVDRLYEAQLARAQAGRFSRPAGLRWTSLEAIQAAAAARPSPELRNEAIACLAMTDFRPWREWSAPNGACSMVCDPSLVYCARGWQDGTVQIVRIAHDQAVQRLQGLSGPVFFARFSPKGRWLAVLHTGARTAENCLEVWDWAAGRRASSGPRGAVCSAWGPDDSYLAVGTLGKELVIRTVDGTAEDTVVPWA